jgi:hypothetical protein
MRVDDWIKSLQPECALFNGILIRDEYLVALTAVIECSMGTKSIGDDPNRASSHGHAMDVDSNGADLDAAWEGHHMPIDGGILSTPFSNPFAKASPQPSLKEEAGFILIGHPGIGEQCHLLL